MPKTKLLDIVPGEGERTGWAIVGTAVVNVAIIALEIFGISLPEGVWQGINGALGLIIGLFLNDKVTRTEDNTKAIAAAQPTEQPVVVVTTSDPAAKVASSGVSVVK